MERGWEPGRAGEGRGGGPGVRVRRGGGGVKVYEGVQLGGGEPRPVQGSSWTEGNSGVYILYTT